MRIGTQELMELQMMMDEETLQEYETPDHFEPNKKTVQEEQ